MIQDKRECFLCKTTEQLQEHHIFFGTANRKIAELYGYKIELCGKHHNLSKEGVHFNRALDLALKCLAQKHFEEHIGSREEFRKEFGKSYL